MQMIPSQGKNMYGISLGANRHKAVPNVPLLSSYTKIIAGVIRHHTFEDLMRVALTHVHVGLFKAESYAAEHHQARRRTLHSYTHLDLVKTTQSLHSQAWVLPKF